MAEAKLNKEYGLRILGVGALMFGMCIWSLYDGNVAWPRQNRIMERARTMLLATNLTAEAWIEVNESGLSPLDEIFHAVGAKTPNKLIKKVGELTLPERAEDRAALHEAQAKQLKGVFTGDVYSVHDLHTQTLQAIFTFAVGVLAWFSVAIKVRKRFCADETGLHGSGFGDGTIAYGEIARIDWAKWDDKGIVVLALKSGRRLRLDGWHFAGMTAVVDQIKQHRPDLDAVARKA